MRTVLSLLAVFIGVSIAQECGKPSTPPNAGNNSRIVNGEEAIPHSFPWMGSIESPLLGEHWCAASIRALANEPTIHYRGHFLNLNGQPYPIRVAHLQLDADTKDYRHLRGVADGIAVRLLLSDDVGVGIQVLFEFPAEAVPDVLQTNGVGVNSEVWSFPVSCSPSYCGIVLELGHERVDEVGACLFWLLCSEGGQEFLGRIYVDPLLESVQ